MEQATLEQVEVEAETAHRTHDAAHLVWVVLAEFLGQPGEAVGDGRIQVGFQVHQPGIITITLWLPRSSTRPGPPMKSSIFSVCSSTELREGLVHQREVVGRGVLELDLPAAEAEAVFARHLHRKPPRFMNRSIHSLAGPR